MKKMCLLLVLFIACTLTGCAADVRNRHMQMNAGLVDRGSRIDRKAAVSLARKYLIDQKIDEGFSFSPCKVSKVEFDITRRLWLVYFARNDSLASPVSLVSLFSSRYYAVISVKESGGEMYASPYIVMF